MPPPQLQGLPDQLQALEPNEPATDAWPLEAMDLLKEAGLLRQVIPREFGGGEVSPAELLAVYEAVGRGSLTLALILTQHDRACELIATGENPKLASRLLPQIAREGTLTTVGISQLTTSRRHGGPALRAKPAGTGFRLDGFMPWVTSARHARYIVAGAVLEDGAQILVCVPGDAPGIRLDPPMRLMALNRSWTSEVRCEGVDLGREWLLRGPAEKVLTLRAAIRPSAVAAVGIGVAGAILDEMRRTGSAHDAEFEAVVAVIERRYALTREKLSGSADALSAPSGEGASAELRVEVNDLLARLAASLLVLSKGSGYVASHPAQRLASEALFFMVWSAPQPVQLGSLRALWR